MYCRVYWSSAQLSQDCQVIGLSRIDRAVVNSVSALKGSYYWSFEIMRSETVNSICILDCIFGAT